MSGPRKTFALSPNVIPIKGRTVAEIVAAGEWPDQRTPHHQQTPGREKNEVRHGQVNCHNAGAE